MNKVAVVTGSSRGLGKAIALALAKKGFTLAIHYKESQKEAEKVLSIVKKDSPSSIVVSGDLTSEKEVRQIFDKALRKYKKIDLLVNNVGNFLYKRFFETTNDEFKDLIESNIYSTLFCSRAVLPSMRKQKSGYIVNLGSVGSDSTKILEKSTPYYIAKTAIYSLTKIMAHDEAKNGIHINMISPASMAVDIFKPSDFPMGRSADYEDVVKILLFLISKDAYYINGANIEVAGGFIPGMT